MEHWFNQEWGRKGSTTARQKKEDGELVVGCVMNGVF
jgi:hypothetical protein